MSERPVKVHIKPLPPESVAWIQAKAREAVKDVKRRLS